ncbi:MAG: chorismate mutase [Actinoplanes sp.]|jgi:chorismate mutase|nr:chorismate mutase [Actinoplanes sp.]
MSEYTLARADAESGVPLDVFERQLWSALARTADPEVVDGDTAQFTAAILQAQEPTVDELDERLVDLILRRAEYAQRAQLARRAEGLPARQLSGENAMVQRFSARLGRRGSEIATALLALSQPALGG